jgi:hypothetical protein
MYAFNVGVDVSVYAQLAKAAQTDQRLSESSKQGNAVFGGEV